MSQTGSAFKKSNARQDGSTQAAGRGRVNSERPAQALYTGFLGNLGRAVSTKLWKTQRRFSRGTPEEEIGPLAPPGIFGGGSAEGGSAIITLLRPDSFAR